MKLFLNSIFVYIFLISTSALGLDYHTEYTIKVSGIKIGKLNWTLKMDKKLYSNNIRIKSDGLLSNIYWFEGEYFSEGIIQNNKLKVIKYNHVWKTNKIDKNMILVFQNDKLISLEQKPVEEERLRLDVFNISQINDPLSSFLQILLGEKSSLVVDGRRIYTMNAIFNNKNNQTVVEIANYSNLWADHKRSDFEKITFEKNKGFFPFKINIHFDGRVFKLEKN